MALTKVTGQVIKNTTDVTVGVLTVTNTLAVGGTVSIGGTLTYEDVTNVDAVGLITARDGIVVGSGITLSVDGNIFATGVTTVSNGLVVSAGSSIGIGTDSPKSLLTIRDNESANDTAEIRIESLRPAIRFVDFSTSSTESEIVADGNSLRFRIGEETNNDTALPELMRIRSTGNVGIGTHTPDAKLEIYDGGLKVDRQSASGTSNPSIDLRTGSGQARFIIYADDYNDENSNWNFKTNANEEMSFQIATTEALRIDSSANVGIGTSIIDGKLHLSARTGDCKLIIEADNIQDQGNENNNPYIVFRQDGGHDMSAVGNNLFDSADHNALHLANSGSAAGIIFATGVSNGYTNATERARFTNGGGEFLVGIKTSRSMGSRESAIQVEGTSSEGASIRIYRNQTNQNAPTLDFGKSRGSGVLSNTIVQTGDTIGTINWYAADGTDSESRTAHIRSEVEQTVSANQTPGRIIFSTSGPGANSPSERLRINSSGHLIFAGDSNTYIHRPASDTLAIVNGGNESIRITGSSGKIYIGHDAATAISATNTQLQINGTSNATCSMSISRYTNNTNGNFIFFGKSRGTTIGDYTAVQSGDAIGKIRWCAADGTDMAEGAAEISGEVDGSVSSNVVPGRLVFKTSRAGTLTEVMRMVDSGHIGINNTAPDQELDIKAINLDATIRLTGAEAGDASIEMYCDEGDDNPDKWRIINSISSNTLRFQSYAHGDWASTMLLVGDPTDSDLGQVRIMDGSDTLPGLTFIDDTNTGFYRIGSGIIGMSLNGVHKHRFEADGDVVFGGNDEEAVGSFTILPNQDDGAARVSFNRSNTSNSSQAIRFENAGSASGNISYDDDSTTYNTSSDYRLKENDVVISDGITRLKQLRPIKFNWKNKPNKIVDGFFAHEVSSIVPQAVTGSKDQVVTQEDIDRGKTSVHEKLGDPMYQSIDHAKLVPLLTAALQEEISKREEEVNALKERLARAGLW